MVEAELETETGISLALLRGINVGGNNKLPMAELVKLFEWAGCSRVSTYIQSGNLVFEAPPMGIQPLRAVIESEIAARFGLKVPVVLRSALEVAATVKGNPLAKAGVDPSRLHCYFLAEKPSAKAVAGLDYERSPGDTYVVRGREIYLDLPNGMARTKLTNVYFDRQLGTVSTVRNWNTVNALLSLMTGKPTGNKDAAGKREKAHG